MTLSPLDAAEVIQMGWGGRFPLSGLISLVPVGCEFASLFLPRVPSLNFPSQNSDVMICEYLVVRREMAVELMVVVVSFRRAERFRGGRDRQQDRPRWSEVVGWRGHS